MSIFDNESNIKKDLNLPIFREWNACVQKMNVSHELWIGFISVNKKINKFQYVRDFLDNTKRNGTDIFDHIHVSDWIDWISSYDQMLSSKHNGWSYQDLPNNRNDVIGMCVAYILQDISCIDIEITDNPADCWLKNYNRTVRRITQRIREWFDVPKDMHIKLSCNEFYNEFKQAYIFSLRASTYRTNRDRDIPLFDVKLENYNGSI